MCAPTAIDVSTGQVTKAERPAFGRSYQTPYADAIRNRLGVPTIAVGVISSYDDVNSILMAGRADLCALGRVHLYDPMWTLHAAVEQDYDGPGAVWPMPWRAGRRKPQTGRSDGPKPRLELIRSRGSEAGAPALAARRPGLADRARDGAAAGRQVDHVRPAGRRAQPAEQPHGDPAVGHGEGDELAGPGEYTATVPRNRLGRSMLPTSSRRDASAVSDGGVATRPSRVPSRDVAQGIDSGLPPSPRRRT